MRADMKPGPGRLLDRNGQELKVQSQSASAPTLPPASDGSQPT